MLAALNLEAMRLYGEWGALQLPQAELLLRLAERGRAARHALLLRCEEAGEGGGAADALERELGCWSEDAALGACMDSEVHKALRRTNLSHVAAVLSIVRSALSTAPLGRQEAPARLVAATLRDVCLPPAVR